MEQEHIKQGGHPLDLCQPREGISCPPTFHSGNDDWRMVRLATFGSGADIGELWDLGGKLAVRLKDGDWMGANPINFEPPISGALEGLRNTILDGWPDADRLSLAKELQEARLTLSNVEKGLERATEENEALKAQIRGDRTPSIQEQRDAMAEGDQMSPPAEEEDEKP